MTLPRRMARGPGIGEMDLGGGTGVTVAPIRRLAAALAASLLAAAPATGGTPANGAGEIAPAQDGDWRIGFGQGVLEYAASGPDGAVIRVACDLGNGRLGSAIWLETAQSETDLGSLDLVFEGGPGSPGAVGIFQALPGGSREPAIFRLLLGQLADFDGVSFDLGAGRLTVAISGPSDGFADCLRAPG